MSLPEEQKPLEEDDPWERGYQRHIAREADKNMAEMGDVSRGLARGWEGLKGTLYGATGLAGSALDMPKVRDWGFEGYQKKEEEAQKYPGVKFTDSPIDWAQGTLGELLPSMGEAAAGAAVGTLLAPGAGSVAGGVGGRFVVKQAMNRMIKAGAKKYIEKGLTKETAEKAAKETIENEIGRIGRDKFEKGILQNLGAKAGVVGSVAPMEMGGNWGEMMEQGVDNPTTAFATGLGAAFLELAGGNIALVNRFLGKNKAHIFKEAIENGNVKWAAQILKQTVTQGGQEASQEMGQEALSLANVALNDPTFEAFTAENLGRMAQSGGAGLLAGGVGGAVTGIAGKRTEPIPFEVANENLKLLSQTTPEQWQTLKDQQGPHAVAAEIFNQTGALDDTLRLRSVRQPLADPQASIVDRLAAVDKVKAVLKGINANLAKTWTDNAYQAIYNDLPIPMGNGLAATEIDDSAQMPVSPVDQKIAQAFDVLDRKFGTRSGATVENVASGIVPTGPPMASQVVEPTQTPAVSPTALQGPQEAPEAIEELAQGEETIPTFNNTEEALAFGETDMPTPGMAPTGLEKLPDNTPGAELANGFRQGPRNDDSKYRVRTDTSTSGILFERHYIGVDGRINPSTYYIGKDGKLDAFGRTTDMADLMWVPENAEQEQAAVELLDEMGKTSLSDPRYNDLRKKLKDLVVGKSSEHATPAPPSTPAPVPPTEIGGGLSAGLPPSGMGVHGEGVPEKVQVEGASPESGDYAKQEPQVFRGNNVDTIVSPSAKRPNTWQVTSFDKEETPLSDEEFKSYEDAVNAARRDAGITTTEEDEAFKELEAMPTPQPVAEGVKGKEPWMMRREDYVGEGYIHTGLVTNLALKRQVNEWQKRVDALPESKGAAQGLERATRKLNLANEHEEAVKQALGRGENIPEAVLKEYPDLAPPQPGITPVAGEQGELPDVGTEPEAGREPWNVTREEFLRPVRAAAYREKETGRIIEGTPSEVHFQLLEKYDIPLKDIETKYESGFVDKDGKFLTRDEATKLVKRPDRKTQLTAHKEYVSQALTSGTLTPERYKELHEADYGPLEKFAPEVEKPTPSPGTAEAEPEAGKSTETKRFYNKVLRNRNNAQELKKLGIESQQEADRALAMMGNGSTKGDVLYTINETKTPPTPEPKPTSIGTAWIERGGKGSWIHITKAEQVTRKGPRQGKWKVVLADGKRKVVETVKLAEAPGADTPETGWTPKNKKELNSAYQMHMATQAILGAKDTGKFSATRKHQFEKAYETIRLHSSKLGIEVPKLGTMFDEGEYRDAANTIKKALPEWADVYAAKQGKPAPGKEAAPAKPTYYPEDYVKFKTGNTERYGDITKVWDNGKVSVIPDGGKNPIEIDGTQILNLERGGRYRNRVEQPVDKKALDKDAGIIVDRALKDSVTDIGQLTPNEKSALEFGVRSGVIAKGKGGPFPQPKTVYAKPGYDFKGEREKAFNELKGIANKEGKKVAEKEAAPAIETPKIGASVRETNTGISYKVTSVVRPKGGNIAYIEAVNSQKVTIKIQPEDWGKRYVIQDKDTVFSGFKEAAPAKEAKVEPQVTEKEDVRFQSFTPPPNTGAKVGRGARVQYNNPDDQYGRNGKVGLVVGKWYKDWEVKFDNDDGRTTVVNGKFLTVIGREKYKRPTVEQNKESVGKWEDSEYAEYREIEKLEGGERFYRVVWDNISQPLSANTLDTVGLADSSNEFPGLYAIHVTSDPEFWAAKLQEDYDRSGGYKIVEMEAMEGDVLTDDPQYAIPEENGYMADSKILVTSRPQFMRDKSEKGSPVFFQTFTPPPDTKLGVSRIGLTRMAKNAMAAWANAPKIVVVKSQSELPANVLEQNKDNVISGAYLKSQNTAYLVTDNMPSMDFAARTIFHEMAHKGFDLVREDPKLSKPFNHFLDRLYATHTADMEKIGKRRRFDMTTKEGRDKAADEWLARQAEKNPNDHWVRRAIAFIRQWVSKVFPRLKVSNSEIVKWLGDMRQGVIEGEPGVGTNEFAQPVRFSLKVAANKIKGMANFKKWFSGSKVVDENGEPLVVYHGTDDAGFAIFDPDLSRKRTKGIHFADDRSWAMTYSLRNNDAPLYTGEQLFNDPELIEGLEIEEKYFIVDSKGRPTSDGYETKEELFDDYEIDEGEKAAKLYEIYENGDQWDYGLTKEQAIERLNDFRTKSPGIYECYLKMEDPLEIDWQGKGWDEGPTETAYEIYDENGDFYETVFDLGDRKRILRENPKYKSKKIDSPMYFDVDDAVRQARDEGFDGLIVKNIHDSGGYPGGLAEGTEYIVFNSTQIKSIYNQGTWDASNPDIRQQIAYHGTPYIWKPEPGFPHGRPRLDMIGTGEGGAAYGFGWYSAGVEETAKSYRRNIGNVPDSYWEGKLPDRSTLDEERELTGLHEVLRKNANTTHGRAFTKKEQERWRYLKDKENAYYKAVEINRPDSLYTLDIPEGVMGKLLDWDKPLSEQSEYVKRILNVKSDEKLKEYYELRNLKYKDGGMKASKDFTDEQNRRMKELQPYYSESKDTTGSQFYQNLSNEKGSDKAASEYLASIGIPGNTHGGVSKGATGAKYVIWSQPVLDRIALLERNGEKLEAIQEAQKAEQARYQLAGEKAIGAPDAGKPFKNSVAQKPVYHGTQRGPHWKGVVYFADKPEISKTIADIFDEPVKVYGAYIDLQNPYLAEGAEFIENLVDNAKAINDLKEKGHDGAIYKNQTTGHTEYVVFDAEKQVRVIPALSSDAGKQDAAYLSLAERYESGDKSVLPELQRMVDEKTKASQYVTRVYRGTTEQDETVLPKSFEAGGGIFTTNSPEVAEIFRYEREYGEVVSEIYDEEADEYIEAPKGDLQNLYVRLDNPLILDENSDVNAQDFVYDTALQSKIIRDAVEKGYDGIIVKDVMEGVGDWMEEGTTYVVFDPRKVKSADLITHDDQGRIIPLSERFNPQEEDIRYSAQTPEEYAREQWIVKDGEGTSFSVELPDAGKQDARPFIEDEHGKKVVYSDSEYMISVNNENAATYISLWHDGKKVGYLSLDTVTKNGDKYLKVGNIEIDKKHRGKGFGNKLYQVVSRYAKEGTKGIYSYLPDRVNKKQIPAIFKKMGGRVFDGDHAYIDFEGNENIQYNPVLPSSEEGQDTAYLSLAERYESGDKSVLPELQRMVDEAARGAGYPKKQYHQTSVEARDAIYKEGFRLDKGRARLSDEQMPDAFFFKADPKDIGVGDANTPVQMEVYIDPGNAKVFENRAEMVKWLREDADYAKIADELKAYDTKTNKRFEEMWNNLDQSDEDLNKLDTFVSDWKVTDREMAGRARKIVTRRMKAEGIDSITVKHDKGAFNRSTETTAVTDPNRIKSADPITHDDQGRIIPLSQRFNPQEEDIRYSAQTPEEYAREFLKAYLEGEGKTSREAVAKEQKTIEKEFPRTATHILDTFKRMSEIKKKSRQARKIDFKPIERILSVPSHLFHKIEAMGRVFNDGLERTDNYTRITDDILKDNNGQYNTELMDRFRKQDKAGYKKFQNYLKRRDQDQVGYSIKKSEETGQWELFGLKGNSIATFEREGQAVNAMIQAEANDYRKSGASEQAVNNLIAARRTTNNGFNVLFQAMRDLEAYYKETGQELPTETINIDGKAVQVDLRLAIAKMGDMRGFYMPRIRPSGRYVVYARQKGFHPIRKHFELETTAAIWASNKEKQGYSVALEPMKKTPEDVFQMAGSVIAQEAIINAAMEKLNSKKFELKDFGLEAIDRKQGPGKRDFMVKGPTSKDTNTVFKKMGGKFFSSDPGGPRVWHFENPGAQFENRLAKALAFEKAATDVDLSTQAVFAKALVEQVANVIKARGVRQHMIRREDAKGLDVWAGYEEDPAIALGKYARGLAAGEAKKIMARDMLAHFTGTDVSWRQFKEIEGEDTTYEDYLEFVKERRVDPISQSNAFKEGKSYIEHMLRNEEAVDRFVGAVKGIAVLKYLGGRVSAPLVNLTALATSVPASMNGFGNIPLHKTFGYLAKASKYYGTYAFGNKDSLPKDIRLLFDEIHNNGWHAAQYNREALAVLKSKFGRGWDKVMDMAMLGFGATEKINRVSTIAGAYLGLKAQGQTDHDAMLTLAKKISDQAHGTYGKANWPFIARGTNPAAHVIKAFYVFKTFSHNYLLTMKDLWGPNWTPQHAKAFTFMAISPAVLAGAGGMVGWELIMSAIAKAFGLDDPEEDLYAWLEKNMGEHAENYARFGAFGMAGINVKGSLEIGVSDLPTNFKDLLGAPGSVIGDVYEGGKSILKGDVSKGIERIAPLALAGPVRAYREATEGLTTRTNTPIFYGRDRVKADMTDAILRALAFNPAAISKIREQRWSETQQDMRYTEMRTGIYSKIKKFMLKPVEDRGKGEWADIVEGIREYNERVKRMELVGIVPFITDKSIHTNIQRSFKPTKKEMRRRIAANE